MFKRTVVNLFALLLLIPFAVNAELIFTAPPREKPDAGQKIYAPIADALTRLLGEKVTYQYPKDWLTYSMKMRRGDYDLIFDGPQFASWRMTHIQHVPLVRLKGNLGFFIITKKENEAVNDIQDLIAKKICGLASPNLATISMLRQFTNPMRQPIFVETKGGAKAVYKKLKAGKCTAAVIRDSFYKNKLSDADREQLKIIWKSRKMPNQTITVSKKVPEQLREQIIASFTTDKGAESAKGLFNRFSKKSSAFVTAQSPEYDELNLLLEGVVWGW